MFSVGLTYLWSQAPFGGADSSSAGLLANLGGTSSQNLLMSKVTTALSSGLEGQLLPWWLEALSQQRIHFKCFQRGAVVLYPAVEIVFCLWDRSGDSADPAGVLGWRGLIPFIWVARVNPVGSVSHVTRLFLHTGGQSQLLQSLGRRG
jgi:hypothetical protein